jgi:Uma2 family endonuclease
MAVTQRRLTLEEFLELPEEKPALEFHEGVVSQKMSPKGLHSFSQLRLCELINGFAVPPKLALALPELRATYHGASFVPDVSVFRWSRIPRGPKGRPANDLFIPPDIAIEIVSPGQSVRSLREKCRWYVDHGVSIALVADPERDTVIRVVRGQSERILRCGDRVDLDAVLPGFELTVQDLFDSLALD